MPAIPLISTEALRHDLNLELAHSLALASRSLHAAGNILLRRDTNNHIAEVIGVVAGIAVIMGFLLYWGVTKQGSCEWRPAKK